MNFALAKLYIALFLFSMVVLFYLSYINILLLFIVYLLISSKFTFLYYTLEFEIAVHLK